MPESFEKTLNPVELLSPDDIEEDPAQPRQSFSTESLAELAHNIEDTADGSEAPWIDGLLHPVVVYPHPEHQEGSEGPRYRLLAGARRLRAYRLREWPAIPAQVRDSPSSAARTLLTQLNENEGREGVSLWETAQAVKRAWKAWRGEHPGGQRKHFAEEFGRSASWVSQHLAVARARGLARQALEEDLLRHTEAHRLFAKLPPEEQRRLLLEARKSRSVISLKTVRLLLEAERARPKKGQRRPAAPGAETRPGGRPADRPGGRDLITLRLTARQARLLLTALGVPPPEEDRALTAALIHTLSHDPAPPEADATPEADAAPEAGAAPENAPA